MNNFIMINAKDTILLLDKLEKLGFSDDAFAKLHHFRDKGVNETIASHRKYCQKVDVLYENRNNHLVQQRLELVLSAYLSGGFKSNKSIVFVHLAEAAYQEIQ